MRKTYPQIFTQSYDLLLLLYDYTRGFPKSHKYTLGRRIETTAVDIIAGIIEANIERDKRPALRQLNLSLEKLRIFVRIAKRPGIHGLQEVREGPGENRRPGKDARRVDQVGREKGENVKRRGFLFEEIASFENLHAAYWGAAKGKRKRDDVAGFERSLEKNLFMIRDELLSGVLRWGP